MTLIGMLHYRKKPHNVRKAYACASVAMANGVDFVYFSYTGVDFCQKMINGWILKDGNWLKQTVRFPDSIMNISSPRTKEQSITAKALKRSIPFTSHSIGNKMQVYKKVIKGGKFTHHLIPSLNITNPDEILPFIQQYNKAVIKPHSGSKGRSIYFLTLTDDKKVLCISGEKERKYAIEEFNEFIGKLISKRKYLIQPFIECKTKTGLTYDFRLHVQKNHLAKWVITLIYPRISGNKKLTSNVSSGGYRGELVPFLKEEFGSKYFDIKQMLEFFAISFAEHFDSLYNNHSLDELGIDIAIDPSQRIWIFEVNWRPGCKHREFSVAQNLVPYAQYIANTYSPNAFNV